MARRFFDRTAAAAPRAGPGPAPTADAAASPTPAGTPPDIAPQRQPPAPPIHRPGTWRGLPGRLAERVARSPAAAALVGQALGAGCTVALVSPSVPAGVLFGWSGLFALVWLLRLVDMRHGRAAGRPAAVRQRRWAAGAVATSALWAAAVWLFDPADQPLHTTALLLVVSSDWAGAAGLLTWHRRVLAAFTVVCVLPTLWHVARPLHADAVALAGVLALLFAMALLQARAQRRDAARLAALAARAQQLRRARAASEQARREAVAANLAKTQFLAAASHDLRQPLQALALFARQLRGRTHGDADVRTLVDDIDRSVLALDGLFGELLDLTTIDAGGLHHRPTAVPLAPLFQRLRLHHEPVAFDKGLALSFRGGHHAVQADAVMLERVLRNLLANAIRYTADGGVIVSARRRGGQLMLQVWDTGIGIAAADQARVFDAFYRVPGGTVEDVPAAQAADAARSADPATPREAGMPRARGTDAAATSGHGLGLAIVRQLCVAMRAPVTLSSIPGRGSVFRLTLPSATPGAAADRPARPAPVPATTLQGRTVLVIDAGPQAAGQAPGAGMPAGGLADGVSGSALVGLLRRWGATVVLQTAAAPLPRPLPDLAIVDGAAADAVRRAVADLAAAGLGPLPTIVLGSGMAAGWPAHVHALEQPVAPVRLRAMVAYKLRGR